MICCFFSLSNEQIRILGLLGPGDVFEIHNPIDEMQYLLFEKSQIHQTKIKKDISTLFQIKSTAGSKDEVYP